MRIFYITGSVRRDERTNGKNRSYTKSYWLLFRYVPPIPRGKETHCERLSFYLCVGFCLVVSSSPNEHSRLIMAISIRKPIKRMLRRRTASDVIDKVFKLTPSFANCNSTCSIILECLLFRVRTAGPHTSKSFILRYARVHGSTSRSRMLYIQATTALASATLEHVAALLFDSARTTAKPVGPTINRFIKCQNFQRQTFSKKIKASWMMVMFPTTTTFDFPEIISGRRRKLFSRKRIDISNRKRNLG